MGVLSLFWTFLLKVSKRATLAITIKCITQLNGQRTHRRISVRFPAGTDPKMQGRFSQINAFFIKTKVAPNLLPITTVPLPPPKPIGHSTVTWGAPGCT